MMIYMRQNRDFFKERIEVNQEILFPIIRNQIDIRIIPDKVHPRVRRHNPTGIWEKQDKPDEATNQIHNPDSLPATGAMQCEMVHHEGCTKNQERYTGKVMVNIRASRNKYPRKELSHQSNENKCWCNVPFIS